MNSDNFILHVTHVEADKQHLKIWAQTDEHIFQSVNSLLGSLRGKLNHRDASVLYPNSLVAQMHCLARGINNDFHRAIVLDVLADGMALVHFIDFGNVSRVPLCNIRLLDSLGPDANCLFSVPKAATDYVLADVMPIGGQWQDDVVETIRSILINNQYVGASQLLGNQRLVRFSIMSEDFSYTLAKRNMALYKYGIGFLSSICRDRRAKFFYLGFIACEILQEKKRLAARKAVDLNNILIKQSTTDCR